MQKIFISSERLGEIRWNFQKNITCDYIKSCKRPGFHPLSRRYISGNTTRMSNWPTPHQPLKGEVHDKFIKSCQWKDAENAI